MFEFTWYKNGKKQREIVAEEDKDEKWEEINRLVRQRIITSPFCLRIIKKNKN